MSLSCGGTTNYIDSSNILWTPDSAYINIGNTTSANYTESTSSSFVPIRYFPNSPNRKCYRLTVDNSSSLVLVRAKFVYKNYDGFEKPPAFFVSLGTAIFSNVDLSTKDPWTEEFIWPTSKDTISFCLLAIPNKGSPVISSLEIRPLPDGAYRSDMEDFPNKSLRKSYRINCGYSNASLRYELIYLYLDFKIYSRMIYHSLCRFDAQNSIGVEVKNCPIIKE